MGSGSSLSYIPKATIIDPGSLSKDLQKRELEEECPVCLEIRHLHGFVLCTHAACDVCVDKLGNKCPICRSNIVEGCTSEQLHEVLLENLENAGFN